MALLATIVALIAASFFKPPRLFYSYHAQHFAAFYVLAVATALTVKQRTIITLGQNLAMFAVVFELARALSPLHAHTTYLDWFADAAGICAALAPMLAQKIRQQLAG